MDLKKILDSISYICILMDKLIERVSNERFVIVLLED